MAWFKNMWHPIDFLENEEFWCHECDGNKVRSNDTTTGYFFSQFGHTWTPGSMDGKVKGHIDTEYPMVIFAVCKPCLDLAGYVLPPPEDF